MTKTKRASLVFLCSFTMACGVAQMDDDDSLAANQAASRGTQTNALTVAASAAPMSSSGVLDLSKSAEQNADAIAAKLQTKVSTCASAMVSHGAGSATLQVSFGSGCPIADYGTVSGSFALTVSKSTAITLAFQFTNFAVNGMSSGGSPGGSIDGSLTASTADAKTYNLQSDLRAQMGSIKGTGTATLDQGAKGIALSGMGTLVMGGSSIPYQVSGIHHLFGGCYADEGTLTLTETITPKVGPPKTVQTVVTFLPTTPSTGQVQVTVAGKSTEKTLPSYGSCPKT